LTLVAALLKTSKSCHVVVFVFSHDMTNYKMSKNPNYQKIQSVKKSKVLKNPKCQKIQSLEVRSKNQKCQKIQSVKKYLFEMVAKKKLKNFCGSS